MLTKILASTAEYFASTIKDSMAGDGTRDIQLIRMIVTRSEKDLKDIEVAFLRLTGKSLKQWIKVCRMSITLFIHSLRTHRQDILLQFLTDFFILHTFVLKPSQMSVKWLWFSVWFQKNRNIHGILIKI